MAAKFSRSVKEARLGYIMVLPAVVCIVALAMIPLLTTLRYSLSSYRLQIDRVPDLMGIQNFVSLLQDERFWASLRSTLTFTVVSVSFELLLGLAIALLINQQFKGRGMVRAAVLVPWAIPTIISAQLWRLIFNDQMGVANDILVRLGLISGYKSWLGSTGSAMGAAIFSDIWKTMPFMALLLTAGLSVIPGELYESAHVDGASRFRQFWHVTLPLLKPTILVALIFRTLDAFRVFDLIYVLTGGGPANTTEVLSLYAYKTMFRNLDFGMGSALAIMIFIFVAVISVFYIRMLNQNSEL